MSDFFDEEPVELKQAKDDRGPEKIMKELDRSFGDKKEKLRLSISEFKGKKFVNARVFWLTPDGQWAPGKAGVTFKIKELEAVIGALTEARDELVPGSPF